jgi:RNA polymerase-binding protein DksA
MSQYDEIRSQLEKRLQQLVGRVGKIDRDLRTTLSPDSEERATELENDEVLQRLGQDSLAEVRQIQEALERIEGGNYGLCSTCGQAITAPRLTAVPSTTICLSCAS